MYCKNCGKAIADNAEMCIYCGEIFTSDTANTVNINFDSKPNTDNKSSKSKIAGGLLGLFLGTFGIHNFYLGHYVKATIQLILTVLAGIMVMSGMFMLISSIMNSGVDIETLTDEELMEIILNSFKQYGIIVLGQILSSIVGVWAFIESILIFCGVIKDKDGNELK